MEPIQSNHDRREPSILRKIAYVTAASPRLRGEVAVTQATLTPSFPTLFHLLDKVLCVYNGLKFLSEPCTC